MDKALLKKLTKYGLKPNEYVFLHSMYEGYDCHFSIDDDETKNLMNLGYIDTISFNRSKFMEDFISTSDIPFEELYSLYPVEDGGRKLRTVKCSGNTYDECKKKYLDKVKSIEQHKEVIRCLNLELSARRVSGEFWPMLSTWIYQARWEMYSDIPERKSAAERKMI